MNLEFPLTILNLVILGCTALFLLIQILYYLIVYGKIAFKKHFTVKLKENDELPPLSVIIAVKNDEYNIKNKLIEILEQDYPTFEVIVVNDASSDETEFVLKGLSAIYHHLKVVNIVENVNKFQGQKFPISIGIKSAKYEHLVLTKSDCKPNSFDWLKYIASGFGKNKEIVLGYACVENKKGLLNKLVRYDHAIRAMNYLSFALCKNPYMGEGYNLAYKKSLFYKVGGFIKHYNLSAGDDDMFINQITNSKNTSVVLTTPSFVKYDSFRKYKDWIKAKKSNIISKKHFKTSHRFLLNLLPFSTFMFYLCIAVLFFIGIPWSYMVLALLLKFILQIFVYYKAFKRLRIKNLFIFAPILEIYQMILNFFLELRIATTKKSKWR
jgi:glycosyltransferase involved in cell wall biosynthesis